MTRINPLPLPSEFNDVEDYIESLLAFITDSELFQKLCGGVHILDFFVQEPDLYTNLLPQDWRDWFRENDISNILDLLMREDLSYYASSELSNENLKDSTYKTSWRNSSVPPTGLLGYIKAIRCHTLDRVFQKPPHKEGGMAGSKTPKLSYHVSSGMRPKKIHEVQNFAKYIDDLTINIKSTSLHSVTHVIDFGSGQNYLGRALASPPYNKHVVAIESKQLNIEGALNMDVTAKLVKKEAVMRDKKKYRNATAEEQTKMESSNLNSVIGPAGTDPQPSEDATEIHGRVQYIESIIQDGDLSNVIARIEIPKPGLRDPGLKARSLEPNPQLMVVSLHSCGNLLHHGLRSIVLNPAVKAVAMVGCCYNLVTERLGPPTYKLPTLRFQNLRIDRTFCVGDPHGFPMCEHLASYEHAHGKGIRLNITSRMMAVQAPQNWSDSESDAFFTRHFYRALLQRIFLDRGVLGKLQKATDTAACKEDQEWGGSGQPIIIGSLRKACYTSFITYVRGALMKLSTDKDHGAKITECMASLSDEDILRYEENYIERKKDLSVVWSLMAFSAGVVESTIVVDRWLYLREQKEVKDCWVDAVFEYRQSPRNLVVVGIKH